MQMQPFVPVIVIQIFGTGDAQNLEIRSLKLDAQTVAQALQVVTIPVLMEHSYVKDRPKGLKSKKL